MVLQRVAVGLPFDQHDVTGKTRFGKSVQPVELRLASGLPSEAVAIPPDPKADSKNPTIRSEVGDTHCGCAHI